MSRSASTESATDETTSRAFSAIELRGTCKTTKLSPRSLEGHEAEEPVKEPRIYTDEHGIVGDVFLRVNGVLTATTQRREAWAHVFDKMI